MSTQPSKMLSYGFVLSIISVGGIAPMIAFVLGFKARRRILRSEGKITGLRLAWWCMIVGGLGVAAALAIIVWQIVNGTP